MMRKRLFAIALTGILAICTLGQGFNAKASEIPSTTDYTLTIPARLDVTQIGWNESSGITVKSTGTGGFPEEMKINVIAESANGWTLNLDENNKIGYTMKNAADGINTTMWKFNAVELNDNTENGVNRPMGIVVDDYRKKPAGSYSDIVTFTASVTDKILYDGNITVLNYREGDNTDSSERPDKLFDGNFNTKWCTKTNNGGSYEARTGSKKDLVVIKVEEEMILTGYSLVPGSDTSKYPGRNWSKWSIYGGNFENDSSAGSMYNFENDRWVLIQTYTDNSESPSLGTDQQYYDFLILNNSTPYIYYKIVVENLRDNTDNLHQMAEIRLFK